MNQALKKIDWDNPMYHTSEDQTVKPSEEEEQEFRDDSDRKVTRIWGSWDVVHPASAGHESQKNLFLVSTFSATRDHPASYAIYEDSGINILTAVDRAQALQESGQPRVQVTRTFIFSPVFFFFYPDFYFF